MGCTNQNLKINTLVLLFTTFLLSSCSYRLIKGVNGRSHFTSAYNQISHPETAVKLQSMALEISEDEDEKPSSSLATASEYRSSSGMAIALSGDDNLSK